MLTVPFSVLHISIHLIKFGGVEVRVGGGGCSNADIEVCTRGGVANQTFVFFSIVRHASTQRRTPAPRGMASQHLRTFERVPVNKELLTRTVPVNKKSLTGTVPVSNLFHTLKETLFNKIRRVGVPLMNQINS